MTYLIYSEQHIEAIDQINKLVYYIKIRDMMNLNGAILSICSQLFISANYINIE